MVELLAAGFLGFALLLGVKHSFDADHLVAMSTCLTQATGRKPIFVKSLHWAAGHMITASLLTVVLFFSFEAMQGLFGYFETAVALMLIVVGAVALKDVRKMHSHAHRHGSRVHSHPHFHAGKDHHHQHLFGIGIVHGLANNDELLLFLGVGIGLASLGGLLIGLLVFNVGMLLGVALVSVMLSSLTKWGKRIQPFLVGGSGILSVAYGIVLLL